MIFFPKIFWFIILTPHTETILVLSRLVEGHIDIQKLVAFEGTFDKLLNIIKSEGGLLGGVTVEDCLRLMSSLLQYNVSNQKLFRETSAVPQLADLLILDSDPNEPSPILDEQSTNNVLETFEICRLFVREGNDSTFVNQTVLSNAGILFNTLRLAFGSFANIPIRSKALLTVADLVRSNPELQEKLASIDVPYVDLSIAKAAQKAPIVIPVCLALLNWALLPSSVHSFDLRIGSAVCLTSAFHNNTQAKIAFLDDQIESYRAYSGATIKIDSTSSTSSSESDNTTNGSETPTPDQNNGNSFDQSHKQPSSYEIFPSL